MKKALRIAAGTARLVVGVTGIGAASIGIIACFSAVDWPLGVLLVLIGSTVFSVAAGVLHQKVYLVVIPAVAIACCYPIAIALPWLAVKWASRHYLLRQERSGSCDVTP